MQKLVFNDLLLNNEETEMYLDEVYEITAENGHVIIENVDGMNFEAEKVIVK